MWLQGDKRFLLSSDVCLCAIYQIIVWFCVLYRVENFLLSNVNKLESEWGIMRRQVSSAKHARNTHFVSIFHSGDTGRLNSQ